MPADRTPSVNRAAMREQDARLEAIYRDEAPALRGRLLAITRDPAVADDLVGEAFLRLATQIRDGRAPDDPAAWLYRVGRNLAISRGRHESVATRAMPGLLDRGLAESPEDEVIRRERDEVVHDALATLDPGDQELRPDGGHRVPSDRDRRAHRPIERGDANAPVPGTRPAAVAPARGRPDGMTTACAAVRGERPSRGETPAAPARLSSRHVNEGRGEALIARTGELERLVAAWARAASGDPRTVIVAGEAGIGKTRSSRPSPIGSGRRAAGS